MSLDTVDDLHAAEEHGETMRQLALELAAETHESFLHHFPNGAPSFEECEDEHCVGLRARAYRFERPGCDEDCDEDCGGYHPEREENE